MQRRSRMQRLEAILPRDRLRTARPGSVTALVRIRSLLATFGPKRFNKAPPRATTASKILRRAAKLSQMTVGSASSCLSSAVAESPFRGLRLRCMVYLCVCSAMALRICFPAALVPACRMLVPSRSCSGVFHKGCFLLAICRFGSQSPFGQPDRVATQGSSPFVSETFYAVLATLTAGESPRCVVQSAPSPLPKVPVWFVRRWVVTPFAAFPPRG